MSRDGHDEPICDGHGPRAGIVTNQPDGYDKSRGHASTEVCGDPSCRADAIAWVWRKTGEHGVYVSDKKRKVATV